MTIDGIDQLMNSSEKLERGIAELYSLFSKLLPEDREFWEQLSFEEKNHADLITSIQETFGIGFCYEDFPTSLVAESWQEIEKANKVVTGYLAAFQEQLPEREQVFNIALELERAAGELHFQSFMKKSPANILEEMFQQLNLKDKDHALRLHSYMKTHGVTINKKNVFSI